jgi:arsenate reductase-like glutaredoxin family protein
MILYGLKTCDTCRKALKILENAQFVDVRGEGVPAPVLVRAQAEFGEKLLNTRSTTWRGLSPQERAQVPLDLLAAHPALMKRPLIERDGELFLGWSADVQKALLG